MGSPEILNLLLAHGLGATPTLGRAQHDHGPGGALHLAAGAGLLADGLDAGDRRVHRGGHGPVHGDRITAFHKQGLPAVAPQQQLQFLMGDPGQQGWISDLVAVEVQHRQHGTVHLGIEELVDVPGGCQGTRFRFAIAHAGQGDHLRIVKHRSAGVGEHVAQFPSLMNGARGFWGAVGSDVAREGKLFEETPHPLRILALVWVDLAVGAIEIGGAQHSGGAMARPGEVDHVEVVVPDYPVGVGPDEGLARARPPMAQQPVLHMFRTQGFLKQGVVPQVDHAHRQVVGSPPPGIGQGEFLIQINGWHGRGEHQAGLSQCGQRHQPVRPDPSAK